jgi:hypothetical protein
MRVACSLLVLCVLLASPALRAGKLDEVRDAVQGDSDDDDDGDGGDEDSDDDEDIFLEEDHPTGVLASGPMDLSFRLSTEYAYDVDHVHRPSIHAALLLPWVFGLETGWSMFFERTDGSVDRLTFGHAHVLLRLVATPHVAMSTGIGARWMIDKGRVDGGFSYTICLDVLPARYLVVSAAGDVGALGEAFVAHGRLTLGGRVGVLEVYGGYDVLSIGDVVFHGPVAGVRLWF